MLRRTVMHKLVRWHIWLGWLVGVPLILWTVTGLVMVSRPIEQVRGEHLRAKPSTVEGVGLTFPSIAGPVEKVALVPQPRQPVWVITAGDGPQRYSARTGAPVGPVDAGEAREIATATYSGPAKSTGLLRFSAAQAPLDLRKARPSWQVRYDDGTQLYIDAVTGEVLALRTRWWRVFDFMWGLHIMDLQTREETSHPLLILFAALAATGSAIGFVLLFRRRSTARRKGGIG